MLLPDTAAWGEISFKSYKLLQTFKAIISQALWQNISSLAVSIFEITENLRTQITFKE
jgi:hypothetical protein